MKMYRYYTLATSDDAFAFGSYRRAEVCSEKAFARESGATGLVIDSFWTPTAPDPEVYSEAELRNIERNARVNP